MRSSVTPPYWPYEKYKYEGAKYPKQVSNDNLLVEVWIALL